MSLGDDERSSRFNLVVRLEAKTVPCGCNARLRSLLPAAKGVNHGGFRPFAIRDEPHDTALPQSAFRSLNTTRCEFATQHKCAVYRTTRPSGRKARAGSCFRRQLRQSLVTAVEYRIASGAGHCVCRTATHHLNEHLQAYLHAGRTNYSVART
jgi:hypothetical protein